VYENTQVGGRLIHGARFMALYAMLRATHDQMPPVGPTLSSRQKEILRRFAAETPEPLPGTAPAGLAPSIVVDAPASADEMATLDYEITTPLGRSVVGALRAGSVVVAEALAPGRGSILWDTGVVGPGTYALAADLDDGSGIPSGITTVPLGTIAIAHASGNTAPTATILSPTEDFGLLYDAASPVSINVRASDADGNPTTVTLAALRGALEIPIAGRTWDTSGVPAGVAWFLRAVVSDGRASRTVFAGPFVVGHGTTTRRFADVAPLFARCARCHGPDQFASRDAIANPNGTGLALVYRRAVLSRQMPPPSALLRFADFQPLTDAERALLGEWLLAGAPQ